MSKTTTNERRVTPGLKRLRKAANAEAIRTAVLGDQQTGRTEALAKIEAEKTEAAAPATGADAIDLPAGFAIRMAAQTPTDAPAPADAPDAPPAPESPPAPAAAKPKAHFARGVPVPPTPVPTPAESMPGMSRANAALYLAAAAGRMPTPPDFSKPSYAPDRKRLAELVALAEAGDAESLRNYSVRVYYSAALEMDRFRHRCIIALEARARQAAAA